MLIALDARHERARVEATRDLPPSLFRCPGCDGEVILKRGKVVLPHFAHRPPFDCEWASESMFHLEAKSDLVGVLRERGWACDPEVQLAPSRIVDVLATDPSTGRRLGIEVQASQISVEEMKQRISVDRRCGVTTGWLFTHDRLFNSLWVAALSGSHDKVRVPEEVAYLQLRYGIGVFIKWPTDEPALDILRFRLSRSWSDGSEFYDEYGDWVSHPPRQLIRTFDIIECTRLRSAMPQMALGRWSEDWTVGFGATE